MYDMRINKTKVRIGHIAATHGYKSRGENERLATQEKAKNKDEKVQQEPKEIDKALSFEMKLKRIYISKE